MSIAALITLARIQVDVSKLVAVVGRPRGSLQQHSGGSRLMHLFHFGRDMLAAAGIDAVYFQTRGAMDGSLEMSFIAGDSLYGSPGFSRVLFAQRSSVSNAEKCAKCYFEGIADAIHLSAFAQQDTTVG